MVLRLKCLLMVFALSPLFGADELRRVGLSDAKKYAIDHNFQVIGMRRAYDEAQAKLGRSRSSFYPKIGIAAGGDNYITAQTNQTGTVAYLSADYALFTGFEDSYRREIANFEAEKAEIRLRRMEFRVGLDVERAFHEYVFKKRALELKQEALTQNTNHKKMAQQKRRAGLSADSDVMDFDMGEALLKSDILLLEQEMEEVRLELRRLLGEEIGAKIEPVGALQHQHLKGTLMENIQKLRSNSEAVLVASKDLAMADSESRIWKSKWLPRIELQAKAGYLPWDWRPSTGGASAYGMVVAKIDVFSGFDTLWERQESQANRLKQEAHLKDAILGSVTQTEVAYRKIHTIQSRVDLEENNEEMAKKYYQSVLSEYRRGIKNSMDLKVASQGVFEACMKREAFKFDFLAQRIELERALGVPVETISIEEEEHIHEKPAKKR